MVDKGVAAGGIGVVIPIGVPNGCTLNGTVAALLAAVGAGTVSGTGHFVGLCLVRTYTTGYATVD